MEIKNNIINNYEDLNFNEKYNNDIWITIVLIILTTFITGYFIILGTIKSQKAVWESNKCNPLFMPFASIINNSDPNDNFNQCLNNLNYSMGLEFKSPIDSIFAFLMNTFNIASQIVNQILSFFLYLLNLISNFFKSLIETIADLIRRSSVIYSNLMSIVNLLIDTFDIVKYTVLFLLDFIKYSFFLLASNFTIVFVAPSIITFTTLTSLAVIAIILAWALGWVLGLGQVLIANAVLTSVLAMSSAVIMIFLLVLNENLMAGIKRSLCSSYLFNSAIDNCPSDEF